MAAQSSLLWPRESSRMSTKQLDQKTPVHVVFCSLPAPHHTQVPVPSTTSLHGEPPHLYTHPVLGHGTAQPRAQSVGGDGSVFGQYGRESAAPEQEVLHSKAFENVSVHTDRPHFHVHGAPPNTHGVPH
eukprot:TRINITY_DN711_c0_g1_i1.p3 TRINITY_DN711_c0_g1~~TRINITY_DN711_c0_g1_i1.p3  ORF type:complete len:129 (-),score=6.70 TRINITY_DN711_c0_g1_i1:264-650(-)